LLPIAAALLQIENVHKFAARHCLHTTEFDTALIFLIDYRLISDCGCYY